MSEEHHYHHQDNRFWSGFFLGGLIGAIVLFFIGTKEGKKAGKELKNYGGDLLDELNGRLEELKKKGKELALQGEELKEEVVDVLTEKKEKLTVEATEKIDSALSHIEEIQERGREATANIRKTLFKNIPKKS